MKSFIKNLLLASMTAIIILPSCNSGKEYLIEYNLKEGETYKYKTTVDSEIIQSFQGQSMETASLMEMDMTYNVVNIQNDLYTLDLKIDRIKSTSLANGMPMVIDSNTTDTIVSDENLGPIFKAITNPIYTITMDKRGKMEAFSGLDEAFENMFKYFPDTIDNETQEIFSTELRAQFEDNFSMFGFEQLANYYPEKPVKIGESWKTLYSSSLNQVDITIDIVNTLKKVENNIATIVSEGRVYTPEEGISLYTMGMELIMKMNGTQTSTINIDLNTGFLTNMETTQDMEGETSIMGTGMTIPQTFKTVLKMSN